MKTTLYYFSGTGNSLVIARDLARKLSDCSLVPIAKVWQQDHLIAETAAVGLVFPVYFCGLPDIIVEFVKKIRLDHANYLFAVLTYGGGPGRSLTYLETLLRAKSNRLHAGFKIVMPGNYVPLYEMRSESQQQKTFEQAARKVDLIADTINTQRISVEPENLFFKIITPLIYTPWLKSVHRRDQFFSVDPACTACGICEKVCPVNNVMLADSKPQWQHHCQQCFACVHFCPVKAIQYKTKTKQRGRYHHPAITVKDISAQKA
jgi:ferredoxin